MLVDDVDEMATRTLHLLGAHAEREAMGARAREHAALHTWDAAVEAWDALLRSVVAEADPARVLEADADADEREVASA